MKKIKRSEVTEGMAEIGRRGLGPISTLEEASTFELRPEGEVEDRVAGPCAKALRLQRAWCVQATRETRAGEGRGCSEWSAAQRAEQGWSILSYVGGGIEFGCYSKGNEKSLVPEKYWPKLIKYLRCNLSGGRWE